MSFEIFDFDIGDFVEDFGLPGLVIGAGAVILAPILGPGLAKVGKPLAKSAVKGTILVYEKTKGVLAEAKEAFEDIVAESKAELAESSAREVLTVEAETG
ncbi:MAG: DUF5132 domain-containing protein [Prochloraceae cyanobacterium]|nr:DUF5132 domain-containing protein [Prochloraceae cyanobacterium]